MTTAVAVVTGASRGVGKGVAVALGGAGMTVYCTARSAGTPTYAHLGGTVEETARDVTDAGGLGIAVACDHTDDDQVRALFARIARDHGRIDVLVNNVWGGYAAYHEDRFADLDAPFWTTPVAVWDDMFSAGVRAHYVASVLAVALMGPGALIVTISFFPGTYVGDDAVAYSVAKAIVACGHPDRDTVDNHHLAGVRSRSCSRGPAPPGRPPLRLTPHVINWAR